MNKNGIVAVVVVITAVVLVGLWVMRTGQTRPGGRQFDCAAPPAAPSNLAYTQDGNRINGTWAAPGGDEQPATYVIEVGSRTGLNDQGTFVLPATTTLYQGNGSPPGTYFARVYARNACGTSGPSNEVTFTVP
ncbi:MAG: fibronectin type III domain-containing protein [Acidobacteria bacterium]|nr:fibronectin type III domain-containing protein [Acidobacteriota bacterium]